MHIAEFSVKNPVLVNLLMLAILIVGIMSAARLPLELFPSIKLELVSVTTVYPGASAEDVEKLVSIPIEDEINDISGIKVIRSTSNEGLSTIIAELEAGEDIQTIAQKIRSEVAKIEDELPEDAEAPITEEFDANFPLISVAIAGDVPRETLRAFGLRLEDQVKLVPGVDNVVTSGLGDPAFWVYVDPEQLRQYNVTLEQIASAIDQKNLDLPGGAVEQGDAEFLVRVTGRIETVQDLLNIPVKRNPDGRHILLNDIGRIEQGEQETRTKARVNGLPAINLWVNKQKGADSIKTVEEIEKVVEEFNNSKPDEIQVYTTNDSSYWVQERFNTMVSSGVIGLVIVLIILALFLDFRSAFLAAIGLPVAFFGAFILMQFTGVTLNILSMFGLILVLGIIVDDAIIVAENIQRYLQLGYSPVESAIKGTKEVALPVVATILTNIASFLPLLIATGLIGKFMAVIPTVAIYALLVSLIEALIILPSHCADYLKPQPRNRPVRKWVYKIRGYYMKALTFTLKRRYITVATFVVLLALTMVIFVNIPRILFYSQDIAQFFVRVENPTFSNIDSTEESVVEVENVVRQVVPDHVLKDTVAMIGMDISNDQSEFGDHLSTLIVEYEDFAKRSENGIELMEEVRRNVESNVVGPVKLDFVSNEGPPVGKPVDFRIQGAEFDTLKELARETSEYLESIPGVFQASDDLIWGKPEIRINVDESRAAIYGLDTTTIARAIRAAAEGLTVSQTRIGTEEADIIVKYELPSGNLMTLLESYQIPTSEGGWVPLSNVVTMTTEPSMLNISRYDLERSVRITAEINEQATTATEVNNLISAFLDEKLQDYGGYSYAFGGEEEQTRESLESIQRAAIIAVLLIYIILASMLRSYAQPFIIMSVLPFALIGVMVGILLRGEPLTLPALIGVVALLGIVVNDSLVLMTFINARYKKMNRVLAVAFSAKHRFRPIVLTTVTTFGGLASLMIKFRGEAAFLAPMAVALGFGLVFATFITLILIPCLYLMLDDLNIYLKKKWANWRGKELATSAAELPGTKTV
ncbi:MAG: efflux RND transporter permease subunit [Thermodesulfobacteriota bacterium]